MGLYVGRETEYIVKYTGEALQLLPDVMRELVRCKDCYWRSDVTGECTNIESICWRNGCTRDDFYCADGERKKGATE